MSSATSFSSFTRLVTAAYYSRHRSAFHTSLPNLYASLCTAAHPHSESSTQHSQHISFVNELRKIIWPRTTSEEDTLPSCSALDLHWRRCCWVLRVWQQALCSTMQVPNLTQYGWSVNAAGEVLVEWDTEESISAVKALLQSLTSGCSCKTGCTTKRCKCSKAGQRCSVGCHCHDCKNNATSRRNSSRASTRHAPQHCQGQAHATTATRTEAATATTPQTARAAAATRPLMTRTSSVKQTHATHHTPQQHDSTQHEHTQREAVDESKSSLSHNEKQ